MSSGYNVNRRNGLDPIGQQRSFNSNNDRNNNNKSNNPGNIQSYGLSMGIPTDLVGNQGNNLGQEKNYSQYMNTGMSGMGVAGSQQQHQQQQPSQQSNEQSTNSMLYQNPGQQMPYNMAATRQYYPMGPYGQTMMYPYPPMPMQSPAYPMMNGYGMGMQSQPMASPNNIPVDGFVTDMGGDFKILGYGDNQIPSNLQSSNMSYSYGSNPGNTNMSRMGNSSNNSKFTM